MMQQITPIRLILGLLFIALLLIPRVRASYSAWQASSKTLTRLEHTETELQQAPGRIAQLQALKETGSPHSNHTHSIPALLDSLGRLYQVQIVQLPMEQTEPGAIKVSTTLQGRFPAILSFIHALEKSNAYVGQATFRTEDVRQRGSISTYLLCELSFQQPSS